MTWVERQLDRLRSFPPLAVDSALAAAFAAIGFLTIHSQEIEEGLTEPGALASLTAVLVSAPIALRRRAPLGGLLLACAAITAHINANWPEGSLPLSAMVLTYSVGAWDSFGRAGVGLGAVYAALITLRLTDAPGLDTLGAVGNMAMFTVFWVVGVAMQGRRATQEARVREAEERAEVARQSAARALAEERLRIAQELHDVVAHSMSVIAVQAGMGAHVLEDRPEQARAALDAISATSRGTLTELRRLLGVLRDGQGARADAPAPGLADLPQLVEDVRAAGVPVVLSVVPELDGERISAGVQLSAFRVVQEALTNVMKHAGPTSRVEVTVEHEPGALAVEVLDDGRGAASGASTSGEAAAATGHGLLGMRERVELWGGDLTAGPVPGGGYRVRARLPYGDAA